MTSDSQTTAHIPVWGILWSGDRCVIGTISVDRTVSPVTYTAQHDETSREFTNEIAAAAWLERRSNQPARLVLVGRVFTPEHSVEEIRAWKALRRQRDDQETISWELAR